MYSDDEKRDRTMPLKNEQNNHQALGSTITGREYNSELVDPPKTYNAYNGWTDWETWNKAKILENYAEEFGGIDKDDFMVVAALLKKGMEYEAFKYTMKLDTDPKEYLLVTMEWVEKVNMDYADELFGEI